MVRELAVIAGPQRDDEVRLLLAILPFRWRIYAQHHCDIYSKRRTCLCWLFVIQNPYAGLIGTIVVFCISYRLLALFFCRYCVDSFGLQSPMLGL